MLLELLVVLVIALFVVVLLGFFYLLWKAIAVLVWLDKLFAYLKSGTGPSDPIFPPKPPKPLW